MAGIASNLIRRKLTIRDPFVSSVLPRRVPTRHGRHVLVAHFSECPSSNQRPHPPRTVGDDRGTLIRHRFFYSHLEKAPRQGDGSFEMALPILLAFADIEERPLFTPFQLVLHLVNRDFRH